MRGVMVCNPRAGRNVGMDGLAGAVDVFTAAGWDLTLETTSRPGDATDLARAAVESGADAVIVAGGDGTLNEAVQGLAGSETALGYVPYGTVNVWAREMRLPLQAEGAARELVAGRLERVDLGVADGRYFLLMASVGFDSEVLRRAQGMEQYKHRFGVLPYVATGLSTAPLFRGVDVELRYDGLIRRVQALMLVIGNTRLYGGRFQLTPNAVANDGWLDLCIIKGRGPLALVRQSLPVLLSGTISHSDVDVLRVREVSVQADEPIPVQMDGELAGATPMRFAVAPRALSVIVPKNFASNLIA